MRIAPDGLPASRALRPCASRFCTSPATRSPGAPDRVRRASGRPCRAAGFRGKEKEVAAAGTGAGAWTLVGLGPAPASAARWRGDAAPGRPRARSAAAAGSSCSRSAPECREADFRALLPQIALADYALRPLQVRGARGSRAAGQCDRRAAARLTGAASPGAAREAESGRRRRVAGRATSATRRATISARPSSPRRREGPVRRHRLRLRRPRPQADRAGAHGRPARRQRRQRPPAGLPDRRVRVPRGRGAPWSSSGKGITFDSGGISLKPAAVDGRDEVRHDGRGDGLRDASRPRSALRAARCASSRCAPVTENMPGGTAHRPGDILRMRNGKTVEVDNTDAEGRLVLGDALSYAEKFRPDVLSITRP